MLPKLSRTPKFEVWATDSIAQGKHKLSHSDREISLSSKAVRRITCDEVNEVSTSSSHHVVLELDTEKNDHSSDTVFDVTTLPKPTISIEYYDIELCKAVLFTKISLFLQVSSYIRNVSLEYLVDLLNSSIIPAIGSSNPSNDFIGCLYGLDGYYVYTSKGLLPAKQGLQSARIRVHSFTHSEIQYLQSDMSIYTGSGCLLASYASYVIQTIDCIAAMTCEVVGYPSDAYDPLLYENYRPQRGQMTACTNLHALLDNSKRFQLKYSLDENMKNILNGLPQVSGPAADYIEAAVKSLEIELNSSILATLTEGSLVNNPIIFQKQQSYIAIESIYNAIKLLLQSSSDRLNILYKYNSANKVGTNDTPTIVNNPNEDIIISTWKLIKKLAENLTLETKLSYDILNNNTTISDKECDENGNGGGDDEDDNDVHENDQNKNKKMNTNTNTNMNNMNSNNNNKKPVNSTSKKVAIDLNNADLTPAQRAKIEAKQKAKAEKKALKAAKKSSNAGDIKTVSLGVGTEMFRQYLSQFYNPNTTSTTTSTTESKIVDMKKTQLDFLSIQSENNISNFCNQLIEKLVNSGKRRPKIAKGARDFGPDQMRVREQAFDVIRRIFKCHGAVEIDTPVFELKEILTGKYGEDSKLIYNLADQGGELLSLRYDLTVPFARYLAMNSTGHIKRYHIAKVYRRDQPQITRGRYREFYQCDFDIAGNYSSMVADAEAITVGTEILSNLPVGTFMIKLNHRKLLDAIFEISGVPSEKFRPICSAVDKLDKCTWDEVKNEMIYEKGLTKEIADKIGVFVLQSGEPFSMWKKLKESNLFGTHQAANDALNDLYLLFTYLESMGSLQYISFDLSLARGLDYYTGVIYEAVLTSGTSQVGSIAAGGRYDNLVGMFSTSNTQIPCVGISIGIERIFAIIEKMARENNILQTPTVQVYVASIGDKMTAHRMKLTKQLWLSDISAEYSHQENPKFKRQLDEVLERSIPFMIVFGDSELANHTVKIKDMKIHDEVEVKIEEMITYLLSRGCKQVPKGDHYFMNILNQAVTSTTSNNSSNNNA